MNARNLNTPEKIEVHKSTQKKFDTWKKDAEFRRDIRMTIHDRCTQQVRKALLAAHPIEDIEHLEYRITEFMTWARKTSQDPIMSTYMRKSKTVSDYAVAKQFLFETDEAWVERVERLATAIEETGGIRPADDELGNKFIMSSYPSRHGEAILRHEEHLSMVRPAGIGDPVLKTLTQPVASAEEVLLKLGSVKQRKNPTNILLKHRKSPHGNKKTKGAKS